MVSNSKVINDCRPCKRNQVVAEQKKHISLLSGILLALLPKCPFCFLAFSNTLILCGEGHTFIEERTFTSSITINVTLFFCLLTLVCIIFNYRDARTRYAFALAVLGTSFIILSVAAKGGLTLYYYGVLLIFAGVWLNASLLYFVKKIKGHFKKNTSSEFLKY